LDSIKQFALLRDNPVDIKRLTDQWSDDLLREFLRVLYVLNEERASFWVLRIGNQLLCQPVGRNAPKAFVPVN
jgi:hypothetical protein